MAFVYVATSKNLAGWASDVGLTKHVYKIGVAEHSAEEAIDALNGEACAGESDWRLVKQQAVEALDETRILERLGKKEKMIDPAYYPKIRGAIGIFRVKVANVANHLLVQRALAGEEERVGNVKATDIAAYLIQIPQA
jgi:hypothetical protein